MKNPNRKGSRANNAGPRWTWLWVSGGDSTQIASKKNMLLSTRDIPMASNTEPSWPQDLNDSKEPMRVISGAGKLKPDLEYDLNSVDRSRCKKSRADAESSKQAMPEANIMTSSCEEDLSEEAKSSSLKSSNNSTEPGLAELLNDKNDSE